MMAHETMKMMLYSGWKLLLHFRFPSVEAFSVPADGMHSSKLSVCDRKYCSKGHTEMYS